jgi:hypothetical protein
MLRIPDWMQDILNPAIHFISANAVWIFSISILMFVVSLFAIRFLIVRVPADYFVHRHPLLDNSKHPVIAVMLLIGKNIIGIILFILGLIMSLPGVVGQGALTILIGLSLMDFPGKRKLQLKIIGQQLILKTINGIRAKGGKPPLIIPDSSKD